MDKARLAAQLVIDEGDKPKPYVDTVGKITIGVGRNLSDNGLRDSEIKLLLSNDIDQVCVDLDRAYPWWRDLPENQQQVLANMAFNLGLTRLAGFVNMLQRLKNHDFSGAALQMLNSKWAAQVGDRAKRLAKLMVAQ